MRVNMRVMVLWVLVVIALVPVVHGTAEGARLPASESVGVLDVPASAATPVSVVGSASLLSATPAVYAPKLGSVPLDVSEVGPTCQSGVAVSDLSSNYWLARDCEVLLSVKDTLRGRASLNWSADTAMTSWDGVTVSGTPKRVTELRLGSRGLTGVIPPELGSLSDLEQLWLEANRLSGSLPSELGRLSNLTRLMIHDNNLSGAIPSELGRLTMLEGVAFGGNRFTGCVPAEWRRLPRVGFQVGLSYCNSAPVFGSSKYAFTVGEDAGVGTAVGSVSAMDVDVGDAPSYSIVSGNEDGVFSMDGGTGAIALVGWLDYETKRRYALTVAVNDGVGGMATTTASIGVSNVVDVCLAGSAVSDPSANPGLVHDCEVLLVAKGILQGTGSLNWSKDTPMTSWDGVTVDGTPKRVTELRLRWRSLTGSIPWELGSLSELTVLNLKLNSLTGVIPPELGSLSGLTILNLRNNMLTGVIPPELGSLSGLIILKLNNNMLTGVIPPELGGLTNLTFFAVGANSLTGVIPRELGNLSDLEQLWLEENQLSGSPPSELGRLSKLRYLMMWTNGLTGDIPQELGGLTMLENVDFRNNSFTGCIPASWKRAPRKGIPIGLSYCNSAPVFGSSEYAFSVGEDASVGGAVGTISATDVDEENTLSYSIVDGNVGEVFSMATSTGAIMVASGLDYETKRRYGLTVAVNDGVGGMATTTASIGVSNVVDVCSAGSAVSDPSANPGLANDCEVLLVAKDILRGTGSLNWSTGIAMTSWDGVTVGGTPKRVTGLDLGIRGLTGSIPWELGSLSELTSLNLNMNALTGSIPSELGSLSNLTYLRLSRNMLTGSIPSELGSLANATYFNVAVNSLTGGIPPELGNLSSVDQLWLKENPLGGSIPPELGNLSTLTRLEIWKNHLTGSIPSELGRLSNLTRLMMWENNLSGEIPSELGGLTMLESIAFGSNRLTGCAPTEWRRVPWVGFQGGISYCNNAPVFSSSEYAFSVAENAGVGGAVGTVSASDVDHGDTPSYSIVDGNVGGMFSIAGSTGAITLAGGLDYEMRRRYTLTVQASDGQGKTATATAVIGVSNVVDVCRAGSAVSNPSANLGLALDCEVLLVAKDTLRGSGSLNWSTDTAMTSWDGVTVSGTPNRVTGLVLDSHSLTGSIPWELGSLSDLTSLSLNMNSLTGVIPSELGSLSELTSLSLNANSLTGVIPSELGSLGELTSLSLDANSLTGVIPSELGSLGELTSLSLDANSLTGVIPSELGSLGELTSLSLNANSLTGVIPSELGSLGELTSLSLDTNMLTGSIPSELGMLSNLTRLMLHDNNLSGEIPNELGGLANLTTLRIFGGNNRFTGCIPAGWKLRAMTVLPSGFSYCNSAPVFGSSEYAFSVGEDASTGGAVGTISASDVDHGNTLSYSIVDGNEGEAFSIAGSTGAVTLAGELDYETRRRYALTVVVNDGAGGMATTTASIGVSNVVDVCSAGSAVSNPSANAGLANDCEVLLVAKDTLRGTRSLNWSTGIAMTSWDGVTVSGTPNRVTGLSLDSRRLTGSIPWELGSLGALTELNLRNNMLTGVIPSELGSLGDLTALTLNMNSLTGVIPSELGGLTNLSFFAVGSNSLTGVIPGELGNLSDLQELRLEENQLSGSLPSELGRLSKLEYLMIMSNGLTGDIPQELGGLSMLRNVGLGGNSFTGCVPTEWEIVHWVGVQTGLSYCHTAPGTPGIEFEDSRVKVILPNVTGAMSYEVELSGDGSTRTTSCWSPWWCSFTGRVGQSYTARGRYTKSGTLSEWSTPLTFTFHGFLASDSVTATRSGNSITVRWTPASGVVSQKVLLVYATSGCNSRARSWDGPNHTILDGTTSSHTFTNLDLSTYACLFPLVYNYYSTGLTLDHAPPILFGKTPTPWIEFWGSSIQIIPDELPGAPSYEAELSGDGSTRSAVCTYTYHWSCSRFEGRVGQDYKARVRYVIGPGVFTDWSESQSFTFGGGMPSDSVSATISGSSVTVNWTPVATGVVSQRVFLTFTTSGCNQRDRMWSEFSQDFLDSTTGTHTFTNVDLSKYTCVFPVVFNYFAPDWAVTTYQYGPGLRVPSSGGVGGASGAAGASGQAEPPPLDISGDIEPARRFEFDRDPYAFSIGEDADTGAVVGVVRASTVDGAAESYSITAGNEDGKFAIGTTSGEIAVVAGWLDYETTTSYTLTVEARDVRDEATTATVEITVVGVAESSVPGAGPRDLVADASLDSVMLRWSAPDGGVVTGYRVLRRRAQEDDAFVRLAEVATSTPMYVDTRDVAAGAEYVYRVVAVYDGVAGGAAQVSVVIPSRGPRDLVAEASSDSVVLRWSAPEGGGVTGYRVLRRRVQVEDAFVSLAEVATSTPMYVDTRDVAAGVEYVYRVVAVFDGVVGGDAQVSVVIPSRGPRDLVAEASSDSVVLRWVAPEGGGVTGYRVLRRRVQGDDAFVSLAEVATSTPMYVDTRDVAAGVEYVYRVVAVYDGVAGGDARVSVVIPSRGPRDLVADASSESVVLRWSAPEGGGVTGYRVLRRRAGVYDAFVRLAEVATSTPKYVDTRDVAAGVEYVYRVVAVYDGVAGGDAQVSVVIPSHGPRDLVAEASSESVVLRWVAPEVGMVTGYRVLRRRVQVEDAFVSLAEVATSTPMYVDTRDVAAGAEYVYRVVAVYDGVAGGDARVSVVIPSHGPRDLVADASSDSVMLRWVAPEGGVVTGYRVLRRRAGVYDAFVRLAEVATSTPKYVDTRDVAAGVEYVYRVVAVYDGVAGGDAQVSVVIPSRGPRDLVADASSDSVMLRWSAPEGGGVTGYRVLRRRAQEDAFVSLGEVATSTPMYVDTRDVVAGVEYVYRVVAVYDGVAGGDAQVSVVIPSHGPRDLVAEASSESVVLRWVAPEVGMVTGYRVLRRRVQVEDAFVSLAEVATSTPMYVDTWDVAAGAEYVYRVVAVYDGVAGGDAQVSVVIPSHGPRDLVADASSESVMLRWVAPEGGGVTGYRVLRRVQGDDAFVRLAEVATSTPMYVDTRDVVAGAEYVYRVVAVYDGVAGGDARVSVVIPSHGPRDLVADASSESVVLRWSAPDGDGVTGYRVLRRRAQVEDAFVSLAEVATSTPMYVDTRDVAAGAEYVYRVVAVYDGVAGGDVRVVVTTPSALAASVVPGVRRRRA